MKFKFSLHKDNIFIFFTIDEIVDSKSITGDTTIEEQAKWIYRIFKLFEDDGYNPNIYIRGE